jgi:hypothetical protein
LSEYSNHKPRTVPPRVLTPDARARQEAKVLEDARILEEDGGWSPEEALRRARQARGLISAPAPALHAALVTVPELPRDWRRAARDHYGSARVSPGSPLTPYERKMATMRVRRARAKAAAGGSP